MDGRTPGCARGINEGETMKRIAYGILLAGLCLLLQSGNIRALAIPRDGGADEYATDQTTCLAQPEIIEIPKPSLTVSAVKNAPENVIVIGQDKEKLGVTITVTISSLPGKATYHQWVTKRVGRNYPENGWIPDDVTCNAPKNGRVWCYWDEGECKTVEETIYRMLWPERTRVWLEPSVDTRAWLSWNETPGGNPLRYVFPDDWGLGAWTPGGPRKQSLPGTGGEWWTFLFGDPLSKNVPETKMVQVNQPGTDAYSTTPVLGLFGTFSSFPGQNSIATTMDQCLIDNEVKVEGGPAARGCKIFPDGASSTNRVANLTIIFYNIPLDLPGRWFFGITAYQYPAKYNNGKSETKITGLDEYSPELSMGPCEVGFLNNFCYRMLDDKNPNNYFESYLIISTPCLAADPKSCIN
jgi:hypothetical protein